MMILAFICLLYLYCAFFRSALVTLCFYGALLYLLPLK